MTNSYPTQEEIDAAARRLGLQPQSGGAAPPARGGFSRPPQTPTPLPEPSRRPSRGGVGGFARRLVTPLVDLPEQTNPILRAGELGFESLTSPVGLATAALIPVTGGASLGFSGAAGVAARLATRVAAEATVSGGAGFAAEKASEALENAPGVVRIPASIAVGALTGLGMARGLRAATGEAARATAKAAAVAEQSTEALTPSGNLLIDSIRLSAAKLADPAVRRELKAQKGSEIARRIGVGRERVAREGAGLSAREQIGLAESAQAGRQPRIAIPAPELTPETINSLYADLRDSPALSDLDVFGAKRALDDVLMGGVPARYELGLLERVFGPAFTETMQSVRPFSLGRTVMDILNVPRALVASMDLSWPGNQGIFMAPLAPVEWLKTTKNSMRAFADPAYAKEIDDFARGITGSELHKASMALAQRVGLPITGGLTREEPFVGVARGLFGASEAGRVLAASDRAYTTAGNYMRSVMWDKTITQMAKTAAKEGDDELAALGRVPWEDAKRLGDVLSVLTGRSTWSVFKKQEGWASALNAAFFAPSFFASRIQMPLMLAEDIIKQVRASGPGILANPVALYKSDPVLALQMRALGSFTATAGGALGLIAAAQKAGLLPGVSVEYDPRSTSFGKVRAGNTAVDFWGGYSQIASAVARTAMGQQKTQRGNVVDVDRLDIVWDRFVRSKVSPSVGLAWNAKTGTSYTGERVSSDPDDIERQVAAAIMPLAWRDIIDGYREGGALGAAQSAPAIIGARVTNFQSLSTIRDDVARQRFQKPYADLNAGERQEIDNHSRVIDKQREFDMTMGESFGSAVDNITSERLRAENVAATRFLAGQDGISAFADNVMEQQRIAATRRESAAAQFGIQEAPPNSPLQQALSEWRSLYDKADTGFSVGVKTGRIDWDKHAQMERDLFAHLTPEQIDHINNRVKADHDPSVQWFFDNRDYISKSGYYDAADTEFARIAPRVADRGITSYSQLTAAIDLAEMRGETADARFLKAILRPVAARIAAARERLRRADPTLDAALVVNLGYTPKSARTRELLKRTAP